MKSVKLTKRMLKDPATLLKSVGAVHGNKAFPNYVFMNSKDYARLEKSVKALFRKEYPYISDRKLATSVGLHMLDLGPVEMKNGIQEGYVLIDSSSISDEVKLLEKADSK